MSDPLPDAAPAAGGYDAISDIPVPPGFEKRVIELAPRDVLPYHDGSWHDAIVFITAGELELTCRNGVCHRFRTGDILSFAHFLTVTVRNHADTTTRLLAISRKTPP